MTLVPFVLVGILGVDPAASLEVTLKECHVLPESEPSLTKKASKPEHSLVQAFGAQFFRSVDAATAVFLGLLRRNADEFGDADGD